MLLDDILKGLEDEKEPEDVKEPEEKKDETGRGEGKKSEEGDEKKPEEKPQKRNSEGMFGMYGKAFMDEFPSKKK